MMALLIPTYLDLIFGYINDNEAYKIINETNLDNFFKYECKYDVDLDFYRTNNNKYKMIKVANISMNDELNEIKHGVREIRFSHSFNDVIQSLPMSVKIVIFGHDYNQPTPLPNSLTHVTFGTCYNQSTPLPNSLVSVIFGYKYNQPTPLPTSLTYVTWT